MTHPASPAASILRCASIGALLALTTTAHAAPTPYTSFTGFTAATSARATDSFDDVSNTSTTASPLSRSAGAYTYVATTGSGSAFFGAGSGADHWLSTDIPTDRIGFGAFTGGVNAIGGLFFGSDIDGAFQSGSLVITATDATGSTTQTLTSAMLDSFVGFVSTGAITSLTVTALQPVNAFVWPTVNSLVLGQRAVPEPATTALLTLGLGVFVFGARRRRAPGDAPSGSAHVAMVTA